MAHEITIKEDGTSEAAFALVPAWHGLGTVIDHAMSSEEALELAQLNWDVIQLPVAVGFPKVIETPEGNVGGYNWEEIFGNYANVRSDSNKILGLVTKQYNLVQNREAFDFLDALLQDEIITYESAFSLNDGKKVVILARFPQSDIIVDGDEVKRFILFSTSHDGTEGVRIGPTATRVVCANTYRMAVGRGGIERLSLRHSKDIKVKLDEARDLLGLANGAFDRHSEICRQLAKTRLKSKQWQEFLDLMCPIMSENDPDYTLRKERAIEGIREEIEHNYTTHPAQANIRDTCWGAWNAFTQYIDHAQRRGRTEGRKRETRFRVTQYGVGFHEKKRALDVLCKIANVPITT